MYGSIMSEQNQSATRLLPYALGLTIFAISLLIAAYVATHLEEHRQKQTAGNFDSYIERTRQVIEQRQQTLRETATMVESRNYLERPEFAVSANSLVDFYPDLISLAWAPFLTESELPLFIERALRDKVDNLHLRSLPDDPAINAIRDNRHIISDYYFHPQQAKLHADYIKLIQHPSSVEAYVKAFHQQRAIATRPLTIEGASEEASVFLVFYPVYGVEDALHGAEGMLVAVMSTSGLLHSVFNRLDLPGSSLSVTDITLNEQFPVFSHSSTDSATQQTAEINAHSTQMPMFGRVIRIEASIPGESHIDHWLVILIGAILAIWSTLTLKRQQQTKQQLESRVRQKTMEMEVANRRAVLAADSAELGIWEYDLLNGDLIWDDWMFKIYQVDKAGFKQGYDDWKATVHPDDLDVTERQLQQAIKRKKPFNAEFRIVTSEGDIRTLSATALTDYDENGNPVKMTGINRDITEQKKKDESIWRQANFDHLTGLPNRKLFHELLSQEIRSANRNKTQLFVLYLDLDGFKQINDSLGHDAGDELLCQVSSRIRQNLRESDEVSRLGGDEFAIILSDIESFNYAADVATKLIEEVALPYKLGQHEVFISTSMGITNYPKDATEASDLLKYADQSMYVAKAGGKNRFAFFTQALQNASIARLEIATALRHAVENEEFELYYQPIFDLQNGELKKAEGLIRWMQQERGLVSPAAFIPVAEETGSINDISTWIFEDAFKTLSDWLPKLDEGFEFSLNMSPTQLRASTDKYDHWLEQMADFGLQGSNVTIEITEGLLLKNENLVNERLLKYRDAGVKVAIDDFGTGYSSLAYLKEFDIDYLKIDQSFTRNLHTNSTEKSVTEAIIVMAHRLGLEVIAEGVETDEQYEILKNMGCDYGQGYLFSRPLTRSMFEDLYIKRRKNRA